MNGWGSGQKTRFFCSVEVNWVNWVGCFAHGMIVWTDGGEPIIRPIEQIAASCRNNWQQAAVARFCGRESGRASQRLFGCGGYVSPCMVDSGVGWVDGGWVDKMSGWLIHKWFKCCGLDGWMEWMDGVCKWP